MYLAYLDDSDTKQKVRKYQVLSAVIVPDEHFMNVELNMSMWIDGLVPPDRLNQFEEFHACELYGGYGIFEGVERSIRMDAIERLLYVLEIASLPVVYGAIDLERLGQEIFASASPVDMAFRLCAVEIHNWILSTTKGINNDQNLALLIADECDKDIKNVMRKTFRKH